MASETRTTQRQADPASRPLPPPDPSPWTRWGLRLAGGGVALQLAGLAVDALRHASDPDLAFREALFTASNPGHLMLLAGLVLACCGVAGALAGPRLYGRPAPLAARLSAPLVALAALGGGLALGVASPLGHPHPGPPVPGTGLAVPHGLGGHGSGEAPGPVTLDATTKARLERELEVARQVAARYRTVADAERGGYLLATEGIGPHYVNWDLIDRSFDPAHPEQLVAEGTEPGSRIIGLSYYVLGDQPPEGFAGPNDHWHRHQGSCVRDRRVLASDTISDWECRAMGGTFTTALDGWMLHVWVVEGWENPAGIFTADYPPRYALRFVRREERR